MSEVLRISSNEAKEWLEKETSSIFIPVHEKAQNLLNEMKRMLQDVLDVSKALRKEQKRD